MKKKLLLFLVMVLAVGCVLLTACGDEPTDTTLPTSPFAAVTFDSVTATYDGTAKSVAVANLPEGATVSYSVNGGEAVDAVSIVNAGNYTVVATLTKDGVSEQKTASLMIEKAQVALDPSITYFAPSTEIAYDGLYHSPEALVALPEGLSVSMDNLPISNVGDMAVYTISFLFSDAEKAQNYNPPAPITGIQLTIVKGTIDMSGFVFEDAELPYDGAFHKLSYDASTLPEMLDVIVTGGGVNRGEYAVTATFSFKNSADAEKYELPAPIVKTLTIGAGAITLPNVFGDKTVSYNGTNQLTANFGSITGIASTTVTAVNAAGETVTEAIVPGVYTVTVSFTVTDENAFITPDPVSYTLTINKAIRGEAEKPTWAPVGDWDLKAGDTGYFFKDADETHGVELILPADLLGENVTIVYKHFLNGVEVQDTTAAGVYTTYATLTLISDYYVLPTDYTVDAFTWVVADKNVAVGEIVFNADGKVYDGVNYVVSANAANVAGILGYDVVVLDAEGNAVALTALTEAGTYTAVFTFTTDLENGYAPLVVEKEFTIAPALIDISGITVDWDHPLTDGAAYFVYDGGTKKVALTADTVAALNALGVTVTGYEDASASAVGDYTAKALLAVDANHTLADDVLEFAWGIANSDEDSWSDIVK